MNERELQLVTKLVARFAGIKDVDQFFAEHASLLREALPNEQTTISNSYDGRWTKSVAESLAAEFTPQEKRIVQFLIDRDSARAEELLSLLQERVAFTVTPGTLYSTRSHVTRKCKRYGVDTFIDYGDERYFIKKEAKDLLMKALARQT